MNISVMYSSVAFSVMYLSVAFFCMSVIVRHMHQSVLQSIYKTFDVNLLPVIVVHVPVLFI
jgi:hypothetical protein